MRPEEIRAWLLLTLLCMISGIIDRLELCTILAKLYPMKLGYSVEFEFERGDLTDEMDGIIDLVICGTCLLAFYVLLFLLLPSPLNLLEVFETLDYFAARIVLFELPRPVT